MNKRLIKSSFYLYIRTFIALIVSLYTSRVLLDLLGVIDFGIFNIVAGFVSVFSFLNITLTAGTQRFMSFELAKNNSYRLNKTFNSAFIIHLILSILFLFFSESLGIWFLKNNLNIPADRLETSLLVYHFAVFSTIITILQVPFTSILIAYEKMNVYAVLGIINVLIKLLFVVMLIHYGTDKLKLHSFFYFITSLFIFLLYIFYCLCKIKTIRFDFSFDKIILKEMTRFSSWNTLGALATVAADHGINILLNIFYGPSINASRAVAIQIKTAVGSFIGSFQTAVNPQIVKTYSSGKLKLNRNLVLSSSKFSFFLVFILIFPVIAKVEYILELWLGLVPQYTAIFSKLILIELCVETISGPLVTCVQASGKIKKYQIIISFLKILILPFAFLLLELFIEPYVAIIASLIISAGLLFARLLIMDKLGLIYFKEFLKDVLLSVAKVIIFPLLFLIYFKDNFGNNLYGFLSCSIVSVFIICMSIYQLGINYSEKSFLKKYICENYKKLLQKKV